MRFTHRSPRRLRSLLQPLEARSLLTATYLSATGDGNWNSANNWQGNHVPDAGEDVVLGAPGNSNFEHITLATPVVIGSLTFDGAYQLDGASIEMQGDIATTQYTRFSNAVILDHNTAISVGPGVRFDLLGGVTGSAFDIIKNGSGRLQMSGVVSNRSIRGDAGNVDLLNNANVSFVRVNSGATLKGDGTAAGITSVGGTIYFDDYDDGVTDINSTAAVTLDAATTYRTLVADDGNGGLLSGLLTVTGSGPITLGNAALQLDDNGSSFTIASDVTLIDNNTGANVVGTFANLPEGATVTVGGNHLSITYRGGVSGHDVVLTAVGTPPTIASGATTAVSTSRRPTVSVLGAPANGPESALVYSWSVIDAPSNAPVVRFNRNNSNAAKSATPRFKKAGTYQLQCLIVSGDGASAVHTLTLKVKQKATGLRVRPHEATIARGETLQYAGYVYDQFGSRMRWSTPPTVAWSLDIGNGTIDAGGLFAARGRGHAIIRLTVNDFTGVAGATVL